MKKLLLLMLIFTLNCYAKEKIVLIADPRVLAISIHENHEPLIDLTKQKDIGYGMSPLLSTNNNYTMVRKTIYAKLIQAQKLLPNGLKFRIYEGFRSLEIQQKIFQDRYNKLKQENPGMNHEQIFTQSTKFVSPVINLDGSRNIPPHSTGAAIDVYLVDKQGKMVDMGISLNDIYKDLKGVYCRTDSQLISDKAKKYREIMGDALRAEGFVNYPTEFWHWSFGDRYWAYQAKNKYAIYNTVSILK